MAYESLKVFMYKSKVDKRKFKNVRISYKL